ncbi:MAG: glycosyltransferase family 39 protein [Caldilineaceae bacterium]
MMIINQRFVLLLLMLAAFAWRLHGITNQSLWRDEVDAIYFALRDLPDTLAMFGAMAQNGVLYFLSLRGWFHLVGASEFALRYVSVMAGTLTIPLLWQVTRRLLGIKYKITAQAKFTLQATLPFLAALFLAVNPYQLWYGQEGKMYTLVTALTLLAHWCWLTGIMHGGRRIWLIYLITVSLCLYIHLLTIIIIPLHLLWFVIAWPQSRRYWRGYGFALAGLTLPYLPFVWWQWAMLTATDKLTGFNFTPLSEMLYTLLINHSYGLLPPPPIFRLLPIFFIGAVGLLLGAGVIPEKRSEPAADLPSGLPSDLSPGLSAWRRYWLLVSWLFIPIATIYLLSLRQPVYTDRYIIWIAPAAMILLALGIQALYQNSGRIAIPLVLLLLVYTLGFWIQMGWRQKNETIKYDLRSAIHYVAARRTPETLLILQIPHLEFSYRYYTSDNSPTLFATSEERIGRWVGGLWTNGGLPDDQAQLIADQQMQVMTAGVDELWVLSSEVEMWDARHYMRAWLDEHGQLIEAAEFHGVHARHYLLAAGKQP